MFASSFRKYIFDVLFGGPFCICKGGSEKGSHFSGLLGVFGLRRECVSRRAPLRGFRIGTSVS